MTSERLAQALDEQVRRFARAIGRARRSEVTGVHQARVASRRIREMLPLVGGPPTGPTSDERRVRRTRRDVRRIAGALGAVRELDVTRGLLADEEARYAWAAAAVARLRLALDAERRVRHGEFIEALRETGSRALLRDLRRAVAGIAGEADALDQKLDARRRKRAASLALTLRELGTLYVPDRLHAVRVAGKKLRYSLETERAVRRSAVARDIRTLTVMQEHLGRLHDLQVLQDRLRAGARGADASELRRMGADLERECRALHARAITRAPAWLALADRVTQG